MGEGIRCRQPYILGSERFASYQATGEISEIENDAQRLTILGLQIAIRVFRGSVEVSDWRRQIAQHMSSLDSREFSAI